MLQGLTRVIGKSYSPLILKGLATVVMLFMASRSRSAPLCKSVAQVRTMNAPPSGHAPHSHFGAWPVLDWPKNRDTAAGIDPNALLKNLLTRSGLPASEARLLVLRILRDNAERHLSVEQLCAAMVRSEFAPGISTFKTAIYDLTNAGVLSRVLVPLNRKLFFYEITDQPPHRHLYCTKCQKILEICDEVMEQRILHQFALAGLKPANFDLARIGKCLACAKALPGDSRNRLP
ncbi:Fur family transcriptional regulator [Cupriavidus necator]